MLIETSFLKIWFEPTWPAFSGFRGVAIPLAENVLIGTKGAERRLGLGLRATAGHIVFSGVPNRTPKKFKIMLDFYEYSS